MTETHYAKIWDSYFTPARDLVAVVAPARRELDHLLEREVGPLAGEQCDGARHAGDPFERFGKWC